MARDWLDWHAAYDDPASTLSHRLVVVTRLIAQFLDTAPAGALRVLSLCAGDGRDLTGAARDHPRRCDLTGCLVELDPRLALAGETRLSDTGLDVEVREGDAGATEVFVDVLPVDLLLLVGVFGNVTDEDVQATIAAVPALCRTGATVIWTRHRRQPDLTPRIRQWFGRAGCTSTALVTDGSTGFAVGRERVEHGGGSSTLASRLFEFRSDLW